MKWEINIIDFMLIVGIIGFVILMYWWVLGNSPSIEMLGIFLGFVFLVYTIGNGYDMRTVKANTEETLNILGGMDDKLNKLGRLDDIYEILKERLK